jgi:hypothetical protein
VRFQTIILSILFAAVGVACAPPRVVAFSPLASHTLRVAPEQDTDIVWVVKRETINATEVREVVYRCRNSEKGPLCDPAAVPQ